MKSWSHGSKFIVDVMMNCLIVIEGIINEVIDQVMDEVMDEVMESWLNESHG